MALLMERKHIEGQGREVIDRCPDIPVYTADRAVLANLTGYELTRGVLCAMRRRPLPSVEELCASARRVAVLEGVVDTTNIGAIFRSAAALNVDVVLVTPTCCDPLNRRAVRVSMGTVFQVPWTRIGEMAGDWPHPGLDRLKALGFQTAAMALSDVAVSVDDPELMAEERLAIVLGTEGDGLSKQTIADLRDYIEELKAEQVTVEEVEEVTDEDFADVEPAEEPEIEIVVCEEACEEEKPECQE